LSLFVGKLKHSFSPPISFKYLKLGISSGGFNMGAIIVKPTKNHVEQPNHYQIFGHIYVMPF
jgi:hypothetical protein